MTVPATSLLVETMVNKGFFERNPNPEDRRAVCIRLSEKGHEICNDVQSRLLSEIDRVAAVLSQEELETLAAIADKLEKEFYN
jgi:DNA-binding MarR family transcriptional regulator